MNSRSPDVSLTETHWLSLLNFVHVSVSGPTASVGWLSASDVLNGNKTTSGQTPG